MLKKVKMPKGSTLKGKTGYEGDYIEKLIEKRLTGEDIILGGKEMLYTERSEGVLVATNIRADKFNEAMMQMDKIESLRIAKGQEYAEHAKKKAEEARMASDKAGGVDASQN